MIEGLIARISSRNDGFGRHCGTLGRIFWVAAQLVDRRRLKINVKRISG
ncbi:hypothetical protein [Klebsiella pneumoniae]|nr:hypothetical protein [Klebsiella pneumoniae]